VEESQKGHLGALIEEQDRATVSLFPSRKLLWWLCRDDHWLL